MTFVRMSERRFQSLVSVHDSRRRSGYRINTSLNQLGCPCSANPAKATRTYVSSSRRSRCERRPKEKAQPHSKIYGNMHPGWFVLRVGTKDLWQQHWGTAAKLPAAKPQSKWSPS